MTRFALFLSLVLCAIPASVSAAAPTPTPCTAYAGMVDFDHDGACAFVGASTAVTTGWTGVVDCDDTDSARTLGKTEVVGNGIDEDCDGTDLVLPVTEQEWKWFVADEYKGRAPSPNLFIVEYKNCQKATGRCTVVSGNGHGRFDIVNPVVDMFVDIFVQGSAVMRTHGQKADGREVVTLVEYSHYQARCGSSSSYTGPSKATRAKEAIEAAKPLVDDEAAVRKTADDEHDRRLDYIELGNRGRDEIVGLLEDDVTGLTHALDDETRARVFADSQLRKDLAAEALRAKQAEDDAQKAASEAQSTATSAAASASDAQSHGPLLEAGVVGGLILRQGLVPVDADGYWTGEDPVRNPALGNVGFSLRAGVDARNYEVAGFGNLVIGSDGITSEAPDLAIQVGVEGLGRLRSARAHNLHLGGFAAFQYQEDHLNLIDASVISRGVLVGPVLSKDFAPGSLRATLVVRAGFGAEWYGDRANAGDPIVNPGVGAIGTIQVGFLVGAGALR